MPSPANARLACAAPQFVEQQTATELDDWLSYFDPSAVLLTGGGEAPQASNTLRRHLDRDTPLIHPTGNSPVDGPRTLDDIQFIVAPTTDTLQNLSDSEHQNRDCDGPTYVVSGLLELDVDTTVLSASLMGREEYIKALSPKQLNGEYIHISTQLPADYRREWGDLTVVGAGAEAGYADTPLVALDCRVDGRVLTHTLKPNRLGLRALGGVGTKRAQRLRDAGYTTRDEVADTETLTLADIHGLGQTTAERIQQSARAIARGEVVCQSEEPLPNGDPIYIDIETDGLNPTITWLVGVLDGSANDGNYMPFIQTDPDEPGRAIEDFMAWYTANASHRPLVAYRGWKFDFSVIHDHIIEYCPHYEDDWTSSYRFDPYQWAVEDGNAILPGRTNQLEDVGTALGYDRAETGLTGAAVARAYRQWMADRSPETELDWKRFKTYCEDDVRALATIYETLEESSRIISIDEPSRDVSETTTQGSLSDW